MHRNTQKPDAFESGVLTLDQAAHFTGLCRSTLYALIRSGRIAATKVGRRRLVSRSDLMGLLQAGGAQ